MSYKRIKLGIIYCDNRIRKRIVAITSIDNIASGKLLEKVGLQFEKIISDSGEDLKLFGYNA